MQIKVEAGTIDFVNVQLPQFGNSLLIHLAQLCNLKVLFFIILEPLPIARCFVSVVHISTEEAQNTLSPHCNCKFYSRAAVTLSTSDM